ncbi:hypothetical protein AOQ84DRAFT_436524 [Glonium stellatum]|uniref:Uncharacterized protein n=1 Tax=Glonium stellatum TaxID=574774 RepID=A0A8E2F9X3_9PEZI|nr:hypothetical protein AOQ84DRAFT_436524 [Glonium stellatum]
MPRDRRLRTDEEELINDLDYKDATQHSKAQLKSETEIVELEGIPTINAPGYGNWIWAEQRCARRSGLTRQEADVVHELFRMYKDGRNLQEFSVYLNGKLGREYPSARAVSVFNTLMNYSAFIEVLPGNPYLPVKITLWLIKEFYSDAIYDRLRFIETAGDLLTFIREEIQPLVQSSQQAGQRLGTDDQSSVQHEKEGIQMGSLKKLSHAPPQDFDRIDPDSITVGKPTTNPKAPRATIENTASTSKLQLDDLSKLGKQKLDDIIGRLVNTRSKGADDVFRCYLVIGRFAKGSDHPAERFLLLNKNDVLFKIIRKGARSVRGWRTYASFKTLKGFGLYKCDISKGCHLKLCLSQQHQSTLSQFFLAYQASYWHPDSNVAKAWTEWVHKNLNANSHVPFEGKYSLELVYGWSPTRLTFAVSLAVFLSFGIGLGYMLKTGDVSTAWTIASYVVTAAGAVIALIAILGSLSQV